GCRVSGVGCRVSGVGCRVSGVGCRVSGVGCRVSGVGCRGCRDVSVERLGLGGEEGGFRTNVILNNQA
ncbi:hypothetical protein, partial [Coleofasciculus chthonoplastes]|uniref:hypothetical protein n=1 Tax=Coleofasciculus chthonoplastes TaxID=64178 RepID=UPI0032FB309A